MEPLNIKGDIILDVMAPMMFTGLWSKHWC